MARITEKKRIIVHSGEYCNPYCLVWKGKLGWNTWVFERRQGVQATTVHGSSYQYNYTDISTQRGDSGLFSNSETEITTIEAANLTTQQAKGLQTLASSLKVYHWDANSNQFEVKIAAGTFSIYNTGNNRHKITMQVERKLLTISR